MRISVIAKPGKREVGITQIDTHTYAVFVKERPIDGKANEAIVRAIADHLHIPLSSVRIVSGFSSKRKIIDIG